MWSPHFAIYQNNWFGLNQLTLNQMPNINFKLSDDIVMNHYHTKSWEEYNLKLKRGDVVSTDSNKYSEKTFKAHDKNEFEDYSILKYRDERLKLLVSEGRNILEIFSEPNQINFDRILKTVISNLSQGFEEGNTKKFLDNPINRWEYFETLIKFLKQAPAEFFKDKLETYLTCLAASTYLKKFFVDEALGNFLEEFSLHLIYKTLTVEIQMADLQLLMQEMPKILALPYPVVNHIRVKFIKLIGYLKESMQIYTDIPNKLPLWEKIMQWDHNLNMLKAFDNYNYK